MPIRVLLALVLCSQLAVAQGRHTARSMVITRYGIVATSHVQASQAGAEILRKGGSAVDARYRRQCRSGRYRAHDERDGR